MIHSMKRRFYLASICTLLYFVIGCQVLTTQPSAVSAAPPAPIHAPSTQSAARSLTKALEGKVVSIADGDTITVLDSGEKQHRIRLTGIDAPESGQAFGTRSRQRLADLVFGKQVIVEYDKKDRYRRTLGKVIVDGRDANLEQIKSGMAWHYKYYESEQPPEDRKTYAEAEVEARAAKRGLWVDPNPVPPWDFRRGRRGRTGNSEEPGGTLRRRRLQQERTYPARRTGAP